MNDRHLFGGRGKVGISDRISRGELKGEECLRGRFQRRETSKEGEAEAEWAGKAALTQGGRDSHFFAPVHLFSSWQASSPA